MNKKYFSKALCYADRSLYLSIFIITTLYLLFASLTIFLDGPKAIPQLVAVPILSIPVLVVNAIIIFFSYTGKKSKQFYMSTQPYNKDAMIITKFICFSLSYVIPIIIYGIIVSLLYLTGTNDITSIIRNAFDSPLLSLWKTTAFICIAFVSIVSSLQFLQILFGKCKYAFLIPLVFGIFIIPSICIFIIVYLTGVNSALGNNITNNVKAFSNWIISYGNFIEANPGWASLHDLVSIAIFTPLTVFLNRRVKSEKTGDIFMFKPIEVICKALLAVFIGFCAISLIGLILLIIVAKIKSSSLDIDIPNKVVSIISFIMIIAGSGLSVLSYKIINKIEARRA